MASPWTTWCELLAAGFHWSAEAKVLLAGFRKFHSLERI
jgi:hypothetical protein